MGSAILHYRQACHPSLLLTDHLAPFCLSSSVMSSSYLSVLLCSVSLALFGLSCSVFLCCVSLAQLCLSWIPLFGLSFSHPSVLLCSVSLALSSSVLSVLLFLVCLSLIHLSCPVLSVFLGLVCPPWFGLWSVLLCSFCLPLFCLPSYIQAVFLFTGLPLFVYLAVSISPSSSVSLTVLLSPLIYIYLPPPLSIYRSFSLPLSYFWVSLPLSLCFSSYPSVYLPLCVSLVLCCELCFVQAVRMNRFLYPRTYRHKDHQSELHSVCTSKLIKVCSITAARLRSNVFSCVWTATATHIKL
jgi:hypothetical protein